MSNEELIQLLNRYQLGQCTPEEIQRLNDWYDQLGKDLNVPMGFDQRQQNKQKLWEKINQRIDAADNESKVFDKKPLWQVYRPYWLSAAMIVLIGMASLVMYTMRTGRPLTVSQVNAEAHQLTKRTNNTLQPQRILLPDGSLVTLSPRSTIQFTANARSPRRETWLKGKAFFEVQRNPVRPFFVYTGTLVTRVLGTSFWVSTTSNANRVEVSVRTGKVAIFPVKAQGHQLPTLSHKPDSLLLTPNQKATFAADQNQLVVGLVKEPQPIASAVKETPAHFSFNETLLPEVVNQLQRTYGIDIEIGSKALANCRFTGDISQQPLFSKLELICQTLNAHYQIQGTHITINGPGCTI